MLAVQRAELMLAMHSLIDSWTTDHGRPHQLRLHAGRQGKARAKGGREEAARMDTCYARPSYRLTPSKAPGTSGCSCMG